VLLIYFLIILICTRISSQVISPISRFGHTAALVGSQLYITGGTPYENLTLSPYLNDILMLDLSTPLNTASLPWQNLTSKVIGLPQIVYGTACVVSNTIYLFGGYLLLADGTQLVSLI